MSCWADFFGLFKKELPKGCIEVPEVIPDVRRPLTLNDYQTQAFTVAKYPEHGTGSLGAISYCGLGLGESGEVQGKIKKIFRDFNGQITSEIRDAIIDETSDVLWYVAALCTELGVTMDDLAKRNLTKLFDRQKRGVIGGSGDNR